MEENTYLLEMKGIEKYFTGVKALNKAHLKVKKGTVHALMGENGAGKSTLMKILLGLYTPDGGSIVFKGKTMSRYSVSDALKYGISMIHQELSSVSEMTVMENIFLGREITKHGFVQEAKQLEAVMALFQELDVTLSPREKMSRLSTAYVQIVEIAKAISYNADLIIMDEPTSALSEKESANLMNTVRKLRDRGVSIIYITHKMDEVFKIADEVTVLRDGKYVITENVKNLTKDDLIRHMVGREMNQLYPINASKKGEELLRIENYSRAQQFRDISFSVHAGEILGFAGLMGAGRSELLNCIFGITVPDQGDLYVRGKKSRIHAPSDAIRLGMGLVTEDRKLTGIFAPLTVMDNMIMPSFSNYLNKGFISHGRMNEDCQQQRMAMGIKTPDMRQNIQHLSGGNQQKVLLARWMMRDDIDILIVDEPTRGIDVMAKYEIHSMLCDLAEKGKAIIMISSELPEVIGMSNRIVVMCEGRISGIFSREEASQEHIMSKATEFS